MKSNIGHLEGASGIAAIIKATLMLERGFILPNHDFKVPNPKIPWKQWNMKVPVNQQPWPRGKKYISINNFGFGGTNGHVVLEGAPFKAKPSFEQNLTEGKFVPRKLFVFTANDKATLKEVMKSFVVFVEQRPEVFQMDLMDNIAYTLGQRRSLLPYRAALPATGSFQLIQAIEREDHVSGKGVEPLRVGFIFTGQGAQWWGMGRELYEQYPVYAEAINHADRVLAALGADWSLTEELNKDEKNSRVNEAHISQPACTAIQLAVVDLLGTWSVHPTAVAGHSSGEISAAYAAGIITFESAVAIAYHRGRLIPVLKKENPQLQGRMMAVGGTKEEFQPLIDGLVEKEVRIACYNSPTSLTISGDETALTELEKICEKKELFNRRLVIETAYHSHHMNLVAKEYRNSLLKLKQPEETTVRFHSSLHGTLVKHTELQSGYWVDNLTCPVRFDEAVQSMLAPADDYQTGVNMLVEIGPHSGLQGPIREILKAVGGAAAKVPYASALVRKKDAVTTLLDVAANLFIKGAQLDFEAINFPLPPIKKPLLVSDLPRYPWNRSTKYWHESRMTQKHKHRKEKRSDILGVEAIYSNDLEPTWRNIVRVDDLPWLRHHKIQSVTMFPMAAFLVMALEAAAQRATAKQVQVDRFELKDVSIAKGLVVPDEDTEMTISLRPYQEGTLLSSEEWDEFRISSYSHAKGWTEHCVGLVATRAPEANDVDGAVQAKAAAAALAETAAAVDQAGATQVKRAELYAALSELGVEYGETFQGIEHYKATDKLSTADITVRDVAKEMPGSFLMSPNLHPALLESLVEMYWPILGAGRSKVNTVYLPSSVSRVSVSSRAIALTQQPGTTLKAFCSGDLPASNSKPAKFTVHATADDASGEPLITLEDLVVAPILDDETDLVADVARELCYKIDWEPILEPVAEAANGDSGDKKFPDVHVAIVHDSSDFQNAVAMDIATALEQETWKMPEMGMLSEIDPVGKICIFLPEIEKPLLSTLTSTEFATLQNVLTSSDGCLWVNRGAYDKSTNPDANMITGLSRTIRSETALKFATLDLDDAQRLAAEDTAKAILKVYAAAFGEKSTSDSELEFMEKAGSFFTPRIVNDDEMNEWVHSQANPSSLEPTPFGDQDRQLKMVLTTPGVLDTVHFIDDPAAGTPLADDQVEIEVKAIGMNFRDVSAAKGQVEGAPGFEASGIVTAIGSAAAFKVGDRVAALTEGAYAARVRTSAGSVFKIPEATSFEAAAALPLAYSIAYHSLVELGRLSEGESVLVHAAAGAVGQAAICLAKLVGAQVYATVSTAEKKELLMKEYGIPEERIFYSRNNSFGKAVRQATGGQGVDVLLNSLSGEALRESWDSLNKFGRFVDIGKRDIAHKSMVEMAHVGNNASFISVDLFALAAQKPKIIERLIAKVASLLQEDKIRPASPITALPISDLENVLRLLQTTRTTGKIVIVPHAEDLVTATPSPKKTSLLRSDATYILVGGTGGLGRSMARWMARNGGKHIVLASRSGSATGAVKELIDELAPTGVEVIVRKCDVVDKASVDDLITNGLQGLPPVRGVVHGTMVLADVLFEQMTYDDYNKVVEGKVKGGWNFHHALSGAPLDFFVAISSAAGAVGNRGQAAYAAANCFLNALVQYRLAQGLPASSLDLTMVSDAGYLTSDADKLADTMRNLGSDSICETEVLALLAAAIGGKMKACNNHTITGMRMTPSMQPFWTTDAKFKYLRAAMEEAAAADASLAGTAIAYGAAVKAAKSRADAEQAICAGLVNKVSSVLMFAPEDLDVNRSLSHYPLDSLVAIEIRNFITREFEANMQVLELLSAGSIQTLAAAVCAKSKLVTFS